MDIRSRVRGTSTKFSSSAASSQYKDKNGSLCNSLDVVENAQKMVNSTEAYKSLHLFEPKNIISRKVDSRAVNPTRKDKKDDNPKGLKIKNTQRHERNDKNSKENNPHNGATAVFPQENGSNTEEDPQLPVEIDCRPELSPSQWGEQLTRDRNERRYRRKEKKKVRRQQRREKNAKQMKESVIHICSLGVSTLL